MKRKQGRPRTKRDPWDFEGEFSVEPIHRHYVKMPEELLKEVSINV